MKTGMGAMAAALALLAQPAGAPAQSRAVRSEPVPVRVGTCAFSRVREVGQRLEDGVTHRVVPDSGSIVTLANGLYQVSYGQVEAVNESRRGDPVYTCLMKLPRGCPPGDTRGRLYTTTNLRTEEILDPSRFPAHVRRRLNKGCRRFSRGVRARPEPRDAAQPARRASPPRPGGEGQDRIHRFAPMARHRASASHGCLPAPSTPAL